MMETSDRTVVTVQVHVLGPPEVVAESGDPVPIGGPKQRTVLALLASELGTRVATDELVLGVYGERAPPGARRTVQTYVSNLRHAVGEALRGTGDGYVLDLPTEGTDVGRFMAAVRTAGALADDDPGQAAADLAAALATWRGAPYDGVDAHGLLDAEIARLEELRLEILEQRIACDLAAGRHDDVVAELTALTAQHPFREALRAQQATALYRSGRQGDALAVLERTRQLLRDELGVDPSPRLQRLERQILVQDPSLVTAPSDRGADAPGSVPGYDLLDLLARTPTSTVHRAVQTTTGRSVTLLIVRRDLAAAPAFIRRFETEGQRVARVDHPNLLPLVDHWRDCDGAYLVHPLVEGRDLRRWSRETRPTDPVRLEVIERLAEAVAHAHTHGVVHGDLREETVLVDHGRGPVVTGLGLVQICGRRVAAGRHGVAPVETGPPSPAADVHALGTLALALLDGGVPIDRRAAAPSSALAEVLARATAPEPTDRQPDAVRFLAELRAATGSRPTDGAPMRRNPYRGLEPFLEADADDFRGREELTAELIDTVRAHRLVTVVGPSGIGKTSVVRAGLLPALRGGAVEGSHRWAVADLHPGSRPFEELAAALGRVAVDGASDLVADLRGSVDGLRRCGSDLLGDQGELLVVVDQFEELFTQTDEGTARAFLAALVTATAEPDTRIRVVTTLRADLFDRPLADAAFGEAMRGGVVAVHAPTRDELRRAVQEPAERVGVEVEPALVRRIVEDADGQPGALPLVQYVLTERFAHRTGDRLGLAAYEQAGGLQGVIGRRAEQQFLALPPAARDVAHHLFVRLVTIDADGRVTRRSAPFGELAHLELPRADVDLVLDVFTRHRLLTRDRDPVSREPTVEVAHEAVLAEWDRLREWIDGVRSDLLTARRVATAAREWLDTGRDPSTLLRGARLEVAERWQRTGGLALTEAEAAYLTASRRAVDAAEAVGRRRQRRTVVVLTSALVVALVLGAGAVRQRAVAQEQVRLTQARKLASEALLAVEADPDRAILLALAAVDAHRDGSGRPTSEAVSALHTAVQTSRGMLVQDGGLLALAISPDGRWMATDSEADPTTVTITDVVSGQQVATIQGTPPSGRPEQPPTIGEAGLAFHPDGSQLAVSFEDTAGGTRSHPAARVPSVPLSRRDTPGRPAVQTFDTGSWQPMATYDGPGERYHKVQFTDDGDRLVAFSDLGAGGDLVAWDVDTGEVTATLAPVGWFDVVPGTTTVAVTQGEEEVAIVDVNDGRTTTVVATPTIVGEMVAVDDDARHIAVKSFPDRVIQVWDLETGQRVARVSNTSPLALDWAPDGRLVHSSNDGTIRLARLGDGEELALRDHRDGATYTAITPDGRTLASVGWSDELRTWDLGEEGPEELGNLPAFDAPIVPVLPSPGGDHLVVGVTLPGRQARIDQVDLRTHRTVTLVDGLRKPANHELRFAPDLSAVAGLDEDLRAHVYELASGEPVADLPPCLSPRALGEDGLVVVDGVLLCLHPDWRELPEPPRGVHPRSGVLDARSGAVVHDLGDRPINWASFGPSGTEAEDLVAVSVDWKTIELHDLDEGRLVGALEIAPDITTSVSFSDDGRHLTVATQSGRVTVVDVAAAARSGDLAAAVDWRFREPAGGVAVLAPIDRGRLATTTMAGHVRVYDLDERRLLADLPITPLAPPWATFGADGDALYYVDGHVVRRFELDLDRLVELAQVRLTRDLLTAEECEQYAIVDRDARCEPAETDQASAGR
jgi:DNA-binding SARP family transcriptional activator/WD40 repeat protein